MNTIGPHDLPERDRRDLAALADGRLDDARAAALEARIRSEPALAAAFTRQREAKFAVARAAAAVEAPTRLRAKVAAERHKRAPRARRAGFAIAAGSLAAVLLALALALPSGPTVVQAATVATRPATEPAPGPGAPKLLDRRAAGLPFPDWSVKFGWRPTGARTDELDGRRLVTVFYAKGEREVAYTVVAGAPLDPPDGSDAVVEGTRLLTFVAGGRTAVTWERGGHTCVLSGTVDGATLRALAAWKGQGAVPF